MNLAWLSTMAERVYGVDYHLDRLHRAITRADGVDVVLGALDDLPITDRSIDLVFCNHVVEHIPDDVGALVELARVLAPGGTLVLGVPNEGAAAWRFAYRLEPRYRKQTDHVHFYTAESIANRCADAGLTVTHVEHIGWGVPSWTLDAVVRRFRWMDDVLEQIGRQVAPRQATSLYVIARRAEDGD